jgi:hypothetical protein
MIYDSTEALKKFEPHYRLVRIGAGVKVEKPSRQQRTSTYPTEETPAATAAAEECEANTKYRQATEEPLQEVPRYRQGQGPQEEQGLSVCVSYCGMIVLVLGGWRENVARQLGYIF